MDKQPPILSVKPAFDPAIAIIESLPVCAAGTVSIVFIGATALILLLHAVGLGGLIMPGPLYSTFFVLGLALTPAAYYEIKKSAYRRTVFHVHPEYISYQDFRFFINRRRGRVRLRDIGDIFERASMLQARRGLTSLYIVIPGFPYSVPGMPPGLRIPDVREDSHLRERLVDLIEDNRKAESRDSAGLQKA